MEGAQPGHRVQAHADLSVEHAQEVFLKWAGGLPVSPQVASRGSLWLTLGFLPGIQGGQPQCLPRGWSRQGQAGMETETLRVLGPELEPHGSRHGGAGPVAPGFPPLQCLTVPVCGQT